MFLHWKRNRLHRHLLFQLQRGGLTGMEKGENVSNAFSNYSSRGVCSNLLLASGQINQHIQNRPDTNDKIPQEL
jgi:hypothetical protein